MTDDKSREAFEKLFARIAPLTNEWADKGIGEDLARRNFAWRGWQAALRYRDEQEKQA